MFDLNRIYNMDCMEAMTQIPDKYFELAIVDPPYGIGVLTMDYTTSGAVRPSRKSAAKRKDYRKQGEWDVTPTQEYFDELFRVSKKQIVWGGNYFSDKLPVSKSFVVWDKRCGEATTNDFADCELAWCSVGMGVARVFRWLWSGMLQGNMKSKDVRFHPTQKPVALYKWLLKNYAKQGDKILDTHMGSGSSIIACIDMGFDYMAFEIDKDYFDMANERIEAHKAQGDLFREVKYEECEQEALNV